MPSFSFKLTCCGFVSSLFEASSPAELLNEVLHAAPGLADHIADPWHAFTLEVRQHDDTHCWLVVAADLALHTGDFATFADGCDQQAFSWFAVALEHGKACSCSTSLAALPF